MDPLITSAIIGAGSALLGGSSSDRSNRHAQDRANAASLASAREDRALQREFAQHGLGWRVDDARAAGLHPLAALGAQLSPFTPGGQGGQTFTGSTKGDAIRAAGAAIAESVARSGKEKAETRLLNAQADLVTQQAVDSQNARLKQVQVNDVVTPDYHKVVDPQFTHHTKFLGMNVKSSPLGSDAQTYEDRYGEVAGAALGVVNVPLDWGYSMGSYLHKKVKNSRLKAPYVDYDSWRYE